MAIVTCLDKWNCTHSLRKSSRFNKSSWIITSSSSSSSASSQQNFPFPNSALSHSPAE
jgi:hypothetical protein